MRTRQRVRAYDDAASDGRQACLPDAPTAEIPSSVQTASALGPASPPSPAHAARTNERISSLRFPFTRPNAIDSITTSASPIRTFIFTSPRMK